MSWLQAHLTVDKEQAPLVEALFESLGALSVTLVDAEDEPMLEPAPGAQPLWSRTRVTGLFAANQDADLLRSRIDTSLDRDSSRSLVLERLEDQPWERAWLDHFRPMRFGKRLWICPSGQQVEAEDAVVVELDPGLAFGTGTHPTTALCLEWLDGAELEGRTVIDYGCGSGILAIAALKLGAARVIALDHDPQALLATHENARRNRVDGRLEACLPRDLPSLEADIVLANILANVLVELAPGILSHLHPAGELVLSGILAHQSGEVVSAYRPDIRFGPETRQHEWVRLQGIRQ